MSARRAGTLIAALIITTVLVPATSGMAAQGLTTQSLAQGLTPTDLVNQLVGAGVTASNVTYTGADVAAGRFAGGEEGPGAIIGFDRGIILSSGDIANVIGPNVSDAITTENGTPGDPDLTILSGFPTFDAAVLEFDFVPNADTVFFSYVFASDEYNEFVNTSFNDVFAFFVNDTNCATVNGAPVSINTINNGNPHGTDPRSNPHLYRNNDLDDGGGTIDTEMDGLTVILTCEASVTPDATNHIKLAIADASDEALDSNVFLAAGSFSTEPPGAEADLSVSKTDDPDPVAPGGTVTYAISVTNQGPDASGVSVTDTISAGTILSAGGTGWSCTHDATSASCTLEGSLAAGSTAPPLEVAVQAPGEAGTITNTATVTGTVTDPDPENNTAVEQTTVTSASRDEVIVFCPPEGCSFRTGDEPTAEDPTVNHVVVPPGGDGSFTRIAEGPTTFPCGPHTTVGDQSRGQETDFLPPTGLDDPGNPIRVTTIWHSSVWPASETKVQICMRKEQVSKSRTKVILFTVKRCKTAGVAKPGPCIEDSFRDASGNMHVRFLMTSKDPQWRR